ncbi:MAG: hypothetical protein MZV70_77085 [Desulfobacterales bacterium]|nr:hypothetical protein [Desulfobacterales bacterium]
MLDPHRSHVTFPAPTAFSPGNDCVDINFSTVGYLSWRRITLTAPTPHPPPRSWLLARRHWPRLRGRYRDRLTPRRLRRGDRLGLRDRRRPPLRKVRRLSQLCRSPSLALPAAQPLAVSSTSISFTCGNNGASIPVNASYRVTIRPSWATDRTTLFRSIVERRFNTTIAPMPTSERTTG